MMQKFGALLRRRRSTHLTFNFAAVQALDPAHPVQITYDRAVQASRAGQSDSGHKRARFFMRHQFAMAALAKWPHLDLAECGCWYGHSTIMTAEAARAVNFKGRFSVFDSFQGLSEFSELDLANGKSRTARQQKRTQLHFAAPEEHLRRITHQYGFVDIYPGWIPTQFHNVRDRTFSFVHIDVDLHAPTRDALEFFYGRLIDGGIIFVDDYGYKNFPGAAVAVDEFLKTCKPAMFLASPVGGAALVK